MKWIVLYCNEKQSLRQENLSWFLDSNLLYRDRVPILLTWLLTILLIWSLFEEWLWPDRYFVCQLALYSNSATGPSSGRFHERTNGVRPLVSSNSALLADILNLTWLHAVVPQCRPNLGTAGKSQDPKINIFDFIKELHWWKNVPTKRY